MKPPQKYPDDENVFIPKLPRREYDSLFNRANYSTLKLLRDVNPARARNAQKHHQEPTEAMIFGQAVHVAVLEPECFEAEVTCGPDHGKQVGKNKEAWSAFEAAHQGMIVLRKKEWDDCLAMRDAVHHLRGPREIIERGKLRESTALWQDPVTGAPMKMRLDMLSTIELGSRLVPAVVDLKTAVSAGRLEFMKQCDNLSYCMQGYIYPHALDLIAPLDRDELGNVQTREFCFIVVEKKPPFEVQTFILGPESKHEGRYRYQKALQSWWTCRQSGRWRSYPSGIQQAEMPRWAMTNERDHDFEVI